MAPLPLRGRRIALSASAQTAARLERGLSDLGAEVVVVPANEIRPRGPPAESARAIDGLALYDWIVFTSAHGVEHFLRLARDRGVAADDWRGRPVCAIGPATARALGDAGIAVALVPRSFAAEGVVEALAAAAGGMAQLAGRRILLPRAREARDLLPRVLGAAGAQVDVVPCYENVVPEDDGDAAARLRARTPDLLAFTSSSAVKGFAQLLGEEAAALFAQAPVAALGPITADTARAYSNRVEIVPAANTVEALVEAVVQYFRDSEE